MAEDALDVILALDTPGPTLILNALCPGGLRTLLDSLAGLILDLGIMLDPLSASRNLAVRSFISSIFSIRFSFSAFELPFDVAILVDIASGRVVRTKSGAVWKEREGR